MNILVTLNEGYLPPLKVMLYSLFQNHSGRLSVYLVYSDISDAAVGGLARFVESHGHALYPIRMDTDDFTDVPVNSYYTKEMYYRLLAHTVLPESVDRALYLDPDILVLNPPDSLYGSDMDGYYFAAAAHKVPVIGYINKLRLRTDADSYYNSGVLLMNVARLRREVRREDVFTFIREHENEMLLPDQDVLNGLFWDRIKPLDETLYNYDARRYRTYLLGSKRNVDSDFIVENTVFLHFCGRQKPWQPGYPYRFGILYKYYQHLAVRDEQELARRLAGGVPVPAPFVEYRKARKKGKRSDERAI